MSNGADLIKKERNRQITEEGWTTAHDLEHESNELEFAAISYALPVNSPERQGLVFWPWPWKTWKPIKSSRIKELVKSGALIAAAIDLELAKKPRSDRNV